MQKHPIPVFDLGGVFIDWNPLYLFNKIFETEEEAIWFLTHICTLDWNLQFDAGMRFETGVAQLITKHPRFWREIQAYDQRWEEMTAKLFQGTIALHDELLAKGIATYAITNFSSEKWISMLDKWQFLSKFDGVVVSGVEKLIKPDPRIYQLFCDRFALSPQACVFIDDNEINVHAARTLGMQAIVFTSADALRADLINLGLPLSPMS